MLLPLLPIQKAMMFDEDYFESDAPNRITVPIVISGTVDADRLVKAIEAEWRRQPVSRLRITRDDFGVPVGQRLEDVPVGGSAPSVAIVRRDMQGVLLHLSFHHVLADRPGIEALLRAAVTGMEARTGARDDGAAGIITDADYGRSVAAILRRLRPAGRGAARDRRPIGPDDPLTASVPLTQAAPARVGSVIPPDVWAAFVGRAAAREMTPNLALLAEVARALDTARAGPPSVIAMPASLRDAIANERMLGSFMTILGVATPGWRTDAVDWPAWARGAYSDALDRRWDVAPDGPPPARRAELQGDIPPTPFDLLFAWHDRSDVDGNGFRISPGMALPHVGHAPLALSVQPGEAGLEMALDHDLGRIDPDAACALLRLIADGVAGRTDEGWTRPPVARHDPPDLLAAIRRQAALRPESVAILDSAGGQISYAGLIEDAARIAAHAAGPGAGRTMLYGRRTIPTFTALLGLLGCGKAFALCEADEAALPAQCDAVEATRLLGDGPALASPLPWYAIGAVLASPEPGPPAPASVCLAPVTLFTSGTAGRPRPVILEPAALAAQAHWATQAFALTADDRVLQINAPGFDAVLEELLPSWSAGATVVIASPACTRSGADLLDFCDRFRISVLNLPTGLFNLAWQSFGEARWPPSLRLVVIGGEAYTEQAVARWLGHAPTADAPRILTTYGPTEATIDVTCVALTGDEPAGLLGAPRPGVDLRVVDRTGRAVEPGLSGELVIGGSALARGYAGRAAETAARFVPDPAGTGDRLYRTGDLVRMTDRGLRYCGRIDRQFKVAGRRLDPAPIEALIAASSGGAQARLIEPRDGVGLAAYVAAAETPALRAAIASALSGLPAWQRPTRLLFGAIPLTGRGKIDDRAMAGGDGALEALPPGGDSPGWRLLCALLSPQRPDPDAPFFASASRSLDVMRLVASCRSRIGRSPSIQDLYLATTAAQVAAVIDRAPAWSPAPVVCEAADDVPASASELALFVDQSGFTGASPYRIDTVWALSAPLDPARLARAVERLCLRHPLLGSQPVVRSDRLVWEAQPAEAAGRMIDARLGVDAGGHPLLHLSVSHLVCGAANLARAADELASLYRADRPTDPIAVPARPAAGTEVDMGDREEDAGPHVPLARLPPDRPGQSGGCAAIEIGAPMGVSAAQVEGRRTSAMAMFVAGTSAWLARFLALDAIIVPIAARLPDTIGEPGIRLEVATLPVLYKQEAGGSLDRMADHAADALGRALTQPGPAAAALARLIREGGGTVPILLDIADARAGATLDFGDAVATARVDRVATVRADIEISLVMGGDGDLSIRLRGREGCYERDTLGHWAASLAAFLTSALADPDRSLDGIALGATGGDGPIPPFAAMLSSPAREALGERGAVRLRTCLRRIGGDPAFREGDRVRRGADLIADADPLAERWQAMTMARGEPVCIRMERGVAYPLALLALWTAGAVPILLNPAHPDGLLDRMERQAGARFRIVADDGADGLRIEAVAGMAEGPPTNRPGATETGTPAAYGAFTSGSTGQPKLVLVGWTGFDRLLDWSRAALAMTPGDHFLHVAAAGFDIGLFEIWAPIVSGAPVCIAPPDAVADLSKLVRLCGERRITHIHLIPTLLAAFLDMARPDDHAALKAVMCGGEAVPVALQHRLVQRGLALHHCYGPTEASIFTLSWFSGDVAHCGTALPLGQPVEGSAVAIVDSLGWPTVRGAEGTVMLIGDCVARGYHHMPRATAERFRPFTRPWHRAYDTGDRAVIRADGSVEFRGRGDRQVKISGIRIEPVEVEAALEAQPGVSRAIVVPFRRGEREALVAVVQPSRAHTGADRAALSQRLLDAIRPALPSAAVPEAVLIAHALPTGPTGKIDYGAIDRLIAEEVAARRPVATERGEESPTETIILDLWGALLGEDNRHPDRNFFAAGGDSMTAIKLVARLAARGIAIGLGDCFRHATPRQLARHVDGRQPTCDPAGAAAGTPARLAPAARHWLASQHSVDPAAAIVLALDHAAPLDPTRVEEALHQVVARHDALRIQVMPDGQGWRTLFAAPRSFACPVHNDPDAACRAARAQVDPGAGRLVGAAITDGGRRLVLAVHHLGMDWHSLPQFAAIVRSAIDNGRPDHPAAPFSSVTRGDDRPDRVAMVAGGVRGRFGVARHTVMPATASAERCEQVIADAVARMLRQRGIARPRIAVEQDGRTERNAMSIGWFTDFRFVAGNGEADGEAVREAVGKADAAINIVAADARTEGFHILADELVPVHPLAVELALGHPATLTVQADERYTPAEREALAHGIATALASEAVAATDLPATSLQRMMLAGTIAYPGKGLYHSQIPLDIVGRWDPARLAGAWERVVARFETLRLRYRMDGEGLVRLWCAPPGGDGGVRIVTSDAGVDAAFRALMAEDIAMPFGPDAPLSRVHLLRARDGDRMLWSHHHAIADGWSLNILLDALSREYADPSGADDRAPPPSLPDYLRWWQGREREAGDGALGEHIRRLAPLAAVPPAYRPSGAATATRRAVDDRVSSAIAALSRARGISEFEFYTTAWALLQARRTGRGVVGFHVVQTVRPPALAGVERLAGLCMTQLPFLVEVSRSFDALLAAVRQAMATMLDAQTASPESVARLLRETTGRTAFESQIIYENYPGDRSGVPLGPDARLVTRESRERSFARHTLVILPGRTVGLELLHDAEPLEQEEADLLMDQFVAIVSQLAKMGETTDA